MLVRSAGRRQRRHTSHLLAASFAQLNLPWLAPAQLRWTATHVSPPPQPPSTRRRDPAKAPRPATQLRTLATAADQYVSRYDSNVLPPPGYGNGFRNSAQDKHVPWDFDLDGPIIRKRSRHLPPRSDPLIIDTSTKSPDALIKLHAGMYGSASELLAHLQTSLSVGRRSRAETILQRMMEQCPPTSRELTDAHTIYLEDAFKNLAAYPPGSVQSKAWMTEMQKWFEVQVQKKGIQPSTGMFVVMIRAALRSLEDSPRDRTIRRYAGLSRDLGDDAFYAVIHSEEFDDQEFTAVGRVTSDFYEDQEVSEDVQTAPEDAQTDRTDVEKPSVTEDLGFIDLEQVPEVRPTNQKGFGLESVKRATEAFMQIPPLPAGASAEEHRERNHARQQCVEELSGDIALERWRRADEELKKIGIHTVMQTRPLAALMWQWYEKLLPALEEELALVKKALRGKVAGDYERKIYGPYFEVLPLRRMAALTIMYTLSMLNRGKDRGTGKYAQEVTLSSLTAGLGDLLASESEAAVSISKNKFKNGVDDGVRRRARGRAAAAKISPQTKSKKSQHAAPNPILEWPLSLKVKLGAVLVSKMIETAQLPVTRDHPRTKEQVTQMQPAFIHRMRYKMGKKTGVLTPNAALVTKLQSEPVGGQIAKRMPMLVEPLPWEGWKRGGYLHYPTPIMRLPIGDRMGKDYFVAADARGDLDTVFKGLTALGSVPWKVNRDVFMVQLEAWNSGEPIANFAPLHPNLELPPEPDSSVDVNARRVWLAEVRDIKNRESGYHSKRCFQNFQLELARSVLNETLYFPHNIDFRGRAYPIPPYLNHMGADNVRALLTFAKGKELGPNGLRWLKIHVATAAGFDKASLQERVDFAMEHLDDIYDSVRNPLTGRRWWLKAEDAWQTLAACFELTKALDSPDPEKFVSYLPIQQDGTCNGLQHYAALGGDTIGATQVNLEPGDRPADVYTAVAEAVKEEVRKDAEAGFAVAQKLHGRITRKCVKQPVMTNVYGVTFHGARLQVLKQLEILFPEVRRSDEVNCSAMSLYITRKIFQSLGSMFSGAQAIQSWLGQCADRVSTCLSPQQLEELVAGVNATPPKARKSPKSSKKIASEDVAGSVSEPSNETAAESTARSSKKTAGSDEAKSSKPLFKSTVVWTTPLGLPVVQPYRTAKTKLVATSMQSMSLQEPQMWDPVSKRKQLQAFPPNFIHSLDATHMLLSALECTSRGMTFASIHDSFWSHACDVNTLSIVLRDQFVAMHSENVIGRLREEFQTRYKDHMYLTAIPYNIPVARKIHECRKSFGYGQGKAKFSQARELVIEVERLKLLRSEDPEERARGEAMQTPGSILLAEGYHDSTTAPAEIAEQKLGKIPNGEEEDSAALDMEDDESSSADADESAMSADGAREADEEVLGEEVDTAAATDRTEEWAADELKLKMNTKKYKSAPKKLFVWMPLEFPPVPQKGDFDVTRLKQSRYFFH